MKCTFVLDKIMFNIWKCIFCNILRQQIWQNQIDQYSDKAYNKDIVEWQNENDSGEKLYIMEKEVVYGKEWNI